MKHDSKTRYEALQAARNGATLREAQDLVGVSRETVRRWRSSEGTSLLVGCGGGSIVAKGDRASAKPARLDLAQRLVIASGLAAGSAHEQIARGQHAARHPGRPHPDVPAHRLVRATAALFVELIIQLCSRGPLPFTALGVVQCRCLGEPSAR